MATACWRSCASSGSSDSSWDGLSRRRRALPRRPEFGHPRVWRCGAREGELVGVLGSWGLYEHGGALRRGHARLWPRLRHGRRREALGRDGIGVRGRNRAREEGETAQELTAGAAVASASSGRHRSERSIEGDLRRPRSETAALARLQGVRRCVAQRGGRGRRGGAYGTGGGAREGWWLRL